MELFILPFDIENHLIMYYNVFYRCYTVRCHVFRQLRDMFKWKHEKLFK